MGVPEHTRRAFVEGEANALFISFSCLWREDKSGALARVCSTDLYPLPQPPPKYSIGIGYSIKAGLLTRDGKGKGVEMCRVRTQGCPRTPCRDPSCARESPFFMRRPAIHAWLDFCSVHALAPISAYQCFVHEVPGPSSLSFYRVSN